MHGQVQVGSRTQTQKDIVLDNIFIAGVTHRDLVRPSDTHVRNCKTAIFVRNRSITGTRWGVYGDNGSSNKGLLGLVDNSPHHGGGGNLGA